MNNLATVVIILFNCALCHSAEEAPAPDRDRRSPGSSLLLAGDNGLESAPGDGVWEKRSMSMLRMGKRPAERSMSMLRMGRAGSIQDDEDVKRSMSMLRMGRSMSMLRMGRSSGHGVDEDVKRSMSMLRMGKRSMSMLRMGRSSAGQGHQGEEDKRSMSMLRMG